MNYNIIDYNSYILDNQYSITLKCQNNEKFVLLGHSYVNDKKARFIAFFHLRFQFLVILSVMHGPANQYHFVVY